MQTKIAPRAFIFGDYNPLSLLLIEELRLLGLTVTVVSENLEEWNRHSDLVKSFADFKNDFNQEPDYIIYVSNTCFTKDRLVENSNDFQKISLVRNLAVESRAKTLFVFPFRQEKITESQNSEVGDEILPYDLSHSSLNFIGDILFETDLKNQTLFGGLLTTLLLSHTCTLPQGAVFYPISANESVRLLLKNLFSLQSYGTKTALLGRPLRLNALAKIFTSLHYRLAFKPQESQYVEASVSVKVYANENSAELIKKYLEAKVNAEANFIPEPREISVGKIHIEEKKSARFPKILSIQIPWKKPLSRLKRSWDNNSQILTKKPRPFFPRKFINWKSKAALLVFFFFLSPLLLVLEGRSALVVAEKSALSGHLIFSKKLLESHHFLFKANEKYSLLVSELPLLQVPYRSLANYSNLLKKEVEIGLKMLTIVNRLLDLSDKLVNEESYDLTKFSENLNFDMSSLYESLGFLESEIKNTDGFPKNNSSFIETTDPAKLREMVYHLSKIATTLPQMLGKDSPKKYMVILSNSYFLRPAGGEFNAFSVITISGGKILKIDNFASHITDKELTGRVDPPQILKSYLNQQSWFLKDAGWDPDFSIAATQAEWFLDKELDLKVDGVISLDKTLFTSILRKMAVANKSILDESEIDSKLQHSWPDSYPDSIENPDLSGYLAKFFELAKETRDRSTRFNLLLDVQQALKAKDIQVYLHDKIAQRVLSDLSWDGALLIDSCEGNCLQDLIGLFETSSSRQGQEIVKEAQISVSLEEKLIKHEFRFFIENNSKDTYKTYLTLVVPPDSGFSPIKIFSKVNQSDVTPETVGIRGLKKAGVFVEIASGESKAIVLTWESGHDVGFSEKGNYELLQAKQAGAEPLTISLEIVLPKTVKVKDQGLFTLTKDGGLTYNTVLTSDKRFSLSWK